MSILVPLPIVVVSTDDSGLVYSSGSTPGSARSSPVNVNQPTNPNKVSPPSSAFLARNGDKNNGGSANANANSSSAAVKNERGDGTTATATASATVKGACKESGTKKLLDTKVRRKRASSSDQVSTLPLPFLMSIDAVTIYTKAAFTFHSVS